MKYILFLLKNSLVTIIFTSLAGIISGFSSAGLISIVNTILSLKSELFTKDNIYTPWVFVGLSVILFVSTIVSFILTNKLVQEIIINLRINLSKNIIACPLEHIESVGSYKLLAVLTEDIDTISGNASTLSMFFVNIGILLGCIIYLVLLSIPVAISIVVFLVLGTSIYQKISQFASYYLKEARELQDNLFQNFQIVTEGTKELKINRERRNNFFEQDLQTTAMSYKKSFLNSMNIYALAMGWANVFLFIPIGLILFVFPKIDVFQNTDLYTLILIFIFLQNPVKGILGNLPQFNQASISLEKIESLNLLLKNEAKKSDLIINSKLNFNWNYIELNNVSYTYNVDNLQNEFTIGPINFKFLQNQIVFIIGKNGTGKSTLIKLITGLYIPTEGKIMVDSIPITNKNREEYRQNFSAVFSDFYLFDSLINLDNNEVDRLSEKYLKKLQLDNKVHVKNRKISTTALSQGQRKRLALLIAYQENRPIYIFDEWASDQDPKFREIFYTQLLPELKAQGKTVIAVSHDDQYFHIADCLLDLDRFIDLTGECEVLTESYERY